MELLCLQLPEEGDNKYLAFSHAQIDLKFTKNVKGTILIFAIAFGIFTVSNLLPVSGQIANCSNDDLQCIANAFQSDPPFSEGGIILFVSETPNQGTDSRNASFDSESWLEWQMTFQDGIETGTTQRIRSSFSEFQAFDPTPLFAFVSTEDPLRTLIEAQVVHITDFSQVGTDFCFDFPRINFEQELFVNGKEVLLLEQLFGSNTINPTTQISEGFGIKFSPIFVDSQLRNNGIFLKSGDQVVWKITADSTYTLWKGQVSDDPDNFIDRCGVTGELAFDGYTVGMQTQMFFTWADPFELISRPTTIQSDLDGDGIPDSIDQCIFDPERFNGFQDDDGCPDEDPIGFDPSLILDMDGDGILDVDDLCPTEGETFNGIEDGDGCPDGATLPSSFPAFEFQTEERRAELQQGDVLESFTPESAILEPFRSIIDIISPTPIDEIVLLEEDPMSEFHTTTEPTGNTGETNFCNRLIENCDNVIGDAIRGFEERTGIQLPFEPTILNIIIILALIVGAIFILRRLLKRR